MLVFASLQQIIGWKRSTYCTQLHVTHGEPFWSSEPPWHHLSTNSLCLFTMTSTRLEMSLLCLSALSVVQQVCHVIEAANLAPCDNAFNSLVVMWVVAACRLDDACQCECSLTLSLDSLYSAGISPPACPPSGTPPGTFTRLSRTIYTSKTCYDIDYYG